MSIYIAHRREISNALDAYVAMFRDCLKLLISNSTCSLRLTVCRLYLLVSCRVLLKVDAAIDSCSKLINLRQTIVDSKHRFDQYVANGNNQVSTRLCRSVERGFRRATTTQRTASVYRWTQMSVTQGLAAAASFGVTSLQLPAACQRNCDAVRRVRE